MSVIAQDLHDVLRVQLVLVATKMVQKIIHYLTIPECVEVNIWISLLLIELYIDPSVEVVKVIVESFHRVTLLWEAKTYGDPCW